MSDSETIEAFGVELTIAEWAHELDLSARRLTQLVRGGVPPEAALLVPNRAHVDPSAPPGGPGSWTWQVLRFEYDPWCQALIRRNGAMTLEQIGEALGITKERVRQEEEAILRKLRARLPEQEFRKLLLEAA